jgi:hypothetical protein
LVIFSEQGSDKPLDDTICQADQVTPTFSGSIWTRLPGITSQAHAHIKGAAAMVKAATPPLSFGLVLREVGDHYFLALPCAWLCSESDERLLGIAMRSGLLQLSSGPGWAHELIGSIHVPCSSK